MPFCLEVLGAEFYLGVTMLIFKAEDSAAVLPLFCLDLPSQQSVIFLKPHLEGHKIGVSVPDFLLSQRP